MSYHTGHIMERTANYLLAFSFFGLFTKFFGWVGENSTTLVGCSAILGGIMYMYKIGADAYDRKKKYKNETIDKSFKKLVEDKKRELSITAHKNGSEINYKKDKK